MIYTFLTLMIVFSSKSYSNPERFSDFYKESGRLKRVDIDNDGVTDLTVKKNIKNEQHTLITFLPSWNKRFKKISKVYKDKIKTDLFIDGKIIGQDIVNRQSEKDFSYINETKYREYKNLKPRKKIFIDYVAKKNFKIISHYIRKGKSWGFQKRIKKKVLTVSNNSGEGENSELSSGNSFTPYRRFDQASDRDALVNTKVGLRIDSKTCSKEKIQKIKEAIDRMVEVQIR